MSERLEEIKMRLLNRRRLGSFYLDDVRTAFDALDAALAQVEELRKARDVAALKTEVASHEIERAGRVLDWIGVARGMPLSERVKLLAVELACKQGYSFTEALEAADGVAGESWTQAALAASSEGET